jgi:MOSC domain-containing protein YiiM
LSGKGFVAGVSLSSKHGVGKNAATEINLIEGLGVEGDAHFGSTVQHLSRLARNAKAPNLRQVHLVHIELIEELKAKGFAVWPGAMGENITTSGLDLLGLTIGAQLALGEAAIVEITGLRNPCFQLDGLQPGLMQATLDRDAAGALVRKLGVMAIVRRGGVVRPGDAIGLSIPAGPHRKLGPV